MRIELIYTFMTSPQDFITYPFVSAILKDEETLKEFVLASLDEVERECLVKVSCCIMTDGQEIDLPEWYNESNGKLWFNEHLLN